MLRAASLRLTAPAERAYDLAERVGRFPSAERDRVPPTRFDRHVTTLLSRRLRTPDLTKGAHMATRSLPARPDLVQLKRQARELHQAHRAGRRAAAARIVAH